MRVDSWTSDQDRLLAETVLQFIRDHKSQLEAFKSVGSQLNRTPSAVGFRWNSNVRKQYNQEINKAKEIRRKNKANRSHQTKKPEMVVLSEENPSELSYDQVIWYLMEQQTVGKRVRELEKLLLKKEIELNHCLQEHERLKDEIDKIQKSTDQSREDHKILIEIMDRARRLTMQDQLA
jgi:prespore-specific regulator